MVINLIVAAFSGFMIPLMMKRAGIDPALAGGVVLTTATDVIGFVSFLGLATMFLL
jgi:magnesium transporter